MLKILAKLVKAYNIKQTNKRIIMQDGRRFSYLLESPYLECGVSGTI